MKTFRFFITILIFLVNISLAFSKEEEDAIAIIRKMEEANTTETSKTELTMLIYNDVYNKEEYRVLKVLSYSQGENNSYMVFLSPKTIKGLSILSKGGDQWIYFPSTGRVRKIAAKSKKKSVQGVGGDFSYEDLGGGNFEEKYTFKILESDSKVWLIEGLPKQEDSVYSRLIITVDKSNYISKHIQYFTLEDGHYKDLIMKEVEEVNGRLMPTKMIMANHQKKSMTVIITNNAEYDIPIDNKYFNPNRFYK